MSDILITGMNLAKDPQKWPNGDILMAHFDCEAQGFAFSGCMLIKTARLGFTIRLPKLEDHRGVLRSVRITDASLRHQMMDAARRAYVAFGGKGGEWTPHQENEQ